MTVTDFEFICQILRDRSGLVLTNDKAYLLESRLLPVARKWKLAGFDELVKAIRTRPDEAMIRDVVEAMTTNESFFFRDIKPFDQFKQLILPALLKNRAASKTIRIWSAACSSGQEAYSLAMILAEAAPQLNGWKIDIVGTDISTEILTRARDGMYSQFEVQRGLPITLLVKYFQQVGDRWQINLKIRNAVQYREFNLLGDPASLGRFDVVFCRNVLIYFDQPTKAKVLNGIAKQMPEDGFLILGGAETVLGLTDRFQLVPGQRGVYCIAGADARSSTAFPAAPRLPIPPVTGAGLAVPPGSFAAGLTSRPAVASPAAMTPPPMTAPVVKAPVKPTTTATATGTPASPTRPLGGLNIPKR
jgi:chemotaxis protein methyltransferase CheR